MAGGKRNPIGTKSVERLLRRYYNLIGTYPAYEIGDTIAPSIDVRPIRPEELGQFGMVPWAAALLQGAVAAQFSFVEMIGVPDYDVLVTRIQVIGGTAWQIRCAAAPAGLFANTFRATDNLNFPMSGAISPVASPIGSGTAGAATGTVLAASLASQAVYDAPIILRDSRSGIGTGQLSVWAETVNQAIQVNLAGVLIPSTSTF